MAYNRSASSLPDNVCNEQFEKNISHLKEIDEKLRNAEDLFKKNLNNSKILTPLTAAQGKIYNFMQVTKKTLDICGGINLRTAADIETLTGILFETTGNLVEKIYNSKGPVNSTVSSMFERAKFTISQLISIWGSLVDNFKQRIETSTWASRALRDPKRPKMGGRKRTHRKRTHRKRTQRR